MRRIDRGLAFAVIVVLIASALVLSKSLSIISLYDVQLGVSYVQVEEKFRFFRYPVGGVDFNPDGVAGYPIVSVSLQTPGSVRRIGRITLHSESGDYEVYGWKLRASVAIKAVPDVQGKQKHNVDVDVKIRVKIYSRVRYSLLRAYCVAIRENATDPSVLAQRHNLWLWQTVIDGAAVTTVEYPLVNADVPNTLDLPYFTELEDALNAAVLPVELEFSLHIGPTVIKDTVWQTCWAAPTLVVFDIAIELVHVREVEPTQPENEPIEDPTVAVAPQPEFIPWWAYWIIAVLLLIAIVVVVVKIPAIRRASH